MTELRIIGIVLGLMTLVVGLVERSPIPAILGYIIIAPLTTWESIIQIDIWAHEEND